MENRVFVLGVWDLFHVGHLNLLKKASILGKVTVGIVCDEAVRRVKGNDKPVIDQESRTEIICAIQYVNSIRRCDDFAIPKDILEEGHYIILIGEDQTHITNLDKINPMWRFNYSRTPGISTSDIVKKIRNQGGYTPVIPEVGSL